MALLALAAEAHAGSGPAAPSPAPPGAKATTRPGSVAVLVLPAPGADPFTADYVAELVLAGAGGTGAYRSVPPELLAAHLARLEKTPAACPADDACVRALAAALDLHHLLVATLNGAKAKTTLSATVVTTGTLALGRAALDTLSGGEEAVLAAAPALGEKLAATAALSTVRLDGPAGMRVSVDGRALGATPLPDGTLRLSPGEHAVALEADGRRPWTSKLSVAPGKRYVLRWK